MAIYLKIANDISLRESSDFCNDNRYIFESVHVKVGKEISRKVVNRDMKEAAIQRMVNDNEHNEFS